MDLNSIFKFRSNSDIENKITDLVVSEDESFLSSVKELYTIEGLIQLQVSSKSNYHNHLSINSKNIRNVIFDMRGISDVQKSCSDIITVLDVNISLLIISDIDSILLQDKVSSLGGIYILWDEKLDSLLYSIKFNGKKNLSNMKNYRVAKRILVLGSKGGIGVSLISSLFSHFLSSKAHLRTLLVDYDSNTNNSDFYIGIKNFKNNKNSKNIFDIEMDSLVAETYIENVDDKLDYLVLDRNSDDFIHHSSSLFKISSELEANYNFIIDSVPSSMFGELYSNDFFEKYHHVFLICEPSVSSLRSCNKLKKFLSKTDYQLIINLNRPLKDFILSISQVKDKLKINNTIDILYEQDIEKRIIQNGIGCLENSKVFEPISEAIKILTGKDINRKSKYSIFKK